MFQKPAICKNLGIMECRKSMEAYCDQWLSKSKSTTSFFLQIAIAINVVHTAHALYSKS